MLTSTRGKPTCHCAIGEAAREPGVGLHRRRPDQDGLTKTLTQAEAKVAEVSAGLGPLRGGQGATGTSSRRWHRSVARPPGPVSNQAAAVQHLGFAAARQRFETILSWLDGDSSTGLDHSELKRQLDVEGRALLRQLLQDHVDLVR